MESSHAKYYWLIVGVASLAVLGIVFVMGDYLAKDAAITPQQITKTEAKARLIIEFQDGSRRRFNGPIDEGMTVRDALEAASASQQYGGFSLALSDNGIEEIGGVKNNSHEWHYYVNGKLMSVSPWVEEVKPGDEIVFRFE